MSKMEHQGLETFELYSNELKESMSNLKSAFDNWCTKCSFPHDEVNAAKEKMKLAYESFSTAVNTASTKMSEKSSEAYDSFTAKIKVFYFNIISFT